MKQAAAVVILLAIAASSAYAQRGRSRNSGPKVGDDAPNIKVKVLGEDKHLELNNILKEKKKPVVLIFGSYT